MTLFQRLVVMTMAILFLALAGNISSGVWSVKEHLNRQLNINAEDAARSLAISMNTALRENDQASLETLLNAMFDGGDYQSIRVFSVNGRLLIEKKSEAIMSDVPSWFKSLIEFKSVTAESEVTDGWQQYGRIFVEPNSEKSYGKLWSITSKMVVWVVLLMGAALIMIIFFMKTLLKPLSDMEHQANAISNRDFQTIPLPKARELRRVVMVMNGMAEKLSKLFSDQAEMTEQLREMSFRDSLTGLSNRRDFVAHFKSYLDPRQGSKSGAMILVGIRAFDKFNQEHGTTKGDELLVQLSNQIKVMRRDHSKIITARLKGAEFGIFIPDVSREHALQALKKLFKDLSMLPAVHGKSDMSDKLHLGLAYYSETSKIPSTGDLISLADQALRRAQGRGRNTVIMLSTSEAIESDGVMGDQAWRGYLEKVLERRAVKLLYQPVKHFGVASTSDYEVLARTDYKDSLVTASLFWPMVERYQWTEQFDQLIITKAMSLMVSQTHDLRLTINVSPKSLLSKKFADWLLKVAQENPAVSKRVILEVSEYALHQDAESIIALSQSLSAYGMKLAIDHFGASSGTFSYLNRVQVDHLKVDRSYIRDVHLSKDNQFYIRSLIQIAHNLDIKVYAEGVEKDEEYEVLKALGLDGAIGYLFGKPLAEPH
ncbi:bifunctional diguanylate cyclase/phosphodiesterase [Litoribrevibacter albus]|uniref:GGDEF domain-containing protein n=1 Tax=Litoribrevibacter albus TaxID=1473156 RepID=A0AA37W6D0_9GAMM|nr:EAL domain-containing protein [Litoribrevibacter albus]GLQ29729.1 GGDEF domain-containing protein [Litoribrevibacter albus]